jgi:hypothetical protein
LAALETRFVVLLAMGLELVIDEMHAPHFANAIQNTTVLRFQYRAGQRNLPVMRIHVH